jgi:hypothetical protein
MHTNKNDLHRWDRDQLLKNVAMMMVMVVLMTKMLAITMTTSVVDLQEER